MIKNIFTDIIFIITLIALLTVFGVGIFFNQATDFSVQENRALSKFPSVSADALLSGDFFSDLGEFYSDRIPFRLALVRLKAICELSFGKSENNGIIFTDGGALVGRCEYQSTSLLERNLSSLKEIDAVTVAVPRSVDVLTQSEDAAKARNLAYSYFPNAEELYRRLCVADGAGEQVYYMTDHHLSYDGAYVLYAFLCESLGVTPYKKEDFSKQLASDSFLGTSYSRGGALASKSDSLFLPRYDGDDSLNIACLDGYCEQRQLYDYTYLEQKDKYSVFLGGNHGTIAVSSSVEHERPRLLLIKDSFANAVIPMLARHFDITVRDPRYDSTPISEDFDCVAVVCGIDTLATTPFSVTVS